MKHTYVRLTVDEIEFAREVAAELGIPVAPAIRRVLRDAASQRRQTQAPAANVSVRGTAATSTEIDLHLLVAVEQVIALIESFLPQGPGAARRILPEAVLAAQRRLELEAGEN